MHEPGSNSLFQFKLPADGYSLENLERELILKALRKFEWNQSKEAHYFDLNPKTLIYRMEQFDLRRDQDLGKT